MSVFFAKRYDFGRNFWDKEGRKETQLPKVVPFSVSVLAAVTNKVETAICSEQRRKARNNPNLARARLPDECMFSFFFL